MENLTKEQINAIYTSEMPELKDMRVLRSSDLNKDELIIASTLMVTI